MTAVLPLLLTLAPQAISNGQGFAEFREKTIERERTGAWKRIRWQPSAADAVRTARMEGKPILAVLITGHLGRKDAADC